MADHITIAPATGTYVVRAGGAIIGETSRALELKEGSHPPVIYVPREDVAMALLERTTRRTTCPWKGEASYFSIRTPEENLENAVWSYEAPKDGVRSIAGHLAFYPDKVTVQRN
jgi:uncharacterized protein (DUF427 family)